MHDLMAELYPICRSITGNGVRETLRVLQKHIPLEIHEVPSGTKVFDWTVPPEWNVSDAYIMNRAGERVVDFNAHNLHLMSYSIPIRKRMGLVELKPHLFTLPDHPEWIPYRTSYYKENWGFCLRHVDYERLLDDEYEVVIDSSLQPGALTYGECYVPGEISDEILISCHVCHPSLCNDNLSGIAVAVRLAEAMTAHQKRYSYRFLFIPGTIGSITWLALNEQRASCIKHGLVITGVGDAGDVTYKRSRQGNAEIDRAMAHVLKHSGKRYAIIDFSPYGYDERQYCSPGFDLPVGCFMRTPHSEYPEYHSSADNLDFVKIESLVQSYGRCLEVFEVLEGSRTYMNQNPKCEPQLGRRGLYRTVAGQQEKQWTELALFWVLNASDGRHTLLDIAERADLPFSKIQFAADALLEVGLLKECRRPGNT
ncbi:MAG: peptidase M28 [Nitrospira sp. SG-bin1]|nr:MAG: peptidase M28 [Nitrospira sp. SG-bin1]